MQNQGQIELPAYSRRIPSAAASSIFSVDPQRFEHSFHLERKGRKWLTLYVRSRSRNASTPPVFLEGDEISGRVELDLERAENIKGITITVQGGTTAVGQEELLFLDVSQPIWTPDPRKKSSEKLEGQHSWNFSLTLPRQVVVSQLSGSGFESGSRGRSQSSSSTSGALSFSLPPNFSERASPAYIDYKLVVTVKRGTFKANQILSPYFAYVPRTSPPPFSRLRQRAYRTNSALVGPEGDPEGWKIIGPIPIRGTLFNSRQIEVQCTLAIATPLLYPVKSHVPLLVSLVSRDGDEQALDILASPSAIKLFLFRSMATGSDAIIDDDSIKRRSNNFFRERMGQAIFWTESSFSQAKGMEQGRRQIQGEIEIKQGLKPSFIFPRLSIRYTLDLLPFEAPGFQSSPLPSSQSSSSVVERDILHSERITITSQPAPGFAPKSYAPPGYERPSGGDYNRSMGMLENGNQRFYHHGR
ncbi:hypothetical protein K435DRAFT_733492 [Dendrothele bispora CBS 962.96]|uniref:Arrestin-like N-terminal domain-containing protein n=1 Tax=Dendrothele bispora (strain CBS 962.96) TaxID=1314807 RepID=A0A4S8L6C2_DENBC|nr:hypothetical protein K435DRAFT_733492 [Dendrothele bispora CBS 962.96]